MIFVYVGIQLICAKDLCNLDELVVVVVSMEERFLAEDL